MSDSGIEMVFAHIDSPRERAIFLLMLDCGLRVGEVHDLSLEDLYFEPPPHLIVYGKGGKQRIVCLSPPIQEALQHWLASRPIVANRAVFISEHGKRLSVSGIQYLLRGYCKKVGLYFTPHQLRHTFEHRMAEAHLPLASLQSMLGHKQVRTTQIYVRLSASHLQAEYDHALSRIVTPHLVDSLVNNMKRKHFPKLKRIDWKAYLGSLPEWLVELIHAYFLQYSQANDPIQQTRNLLSQLSRFFRRTLSHTSYSCPSDVTPKLWFSYVETRLGEDFKPTSLNTALRILQSFLKFVRDSGHPICERMLEVRPLKTGELLPRDITETEFNHLLKQAYLFDYAWILLIVHSGLRTCEIRKLRWSDVDMQRHTVRIEESKGLRSRIVFLSAPTLEALEQLSKTSEYVFTYNNQPLSNRYCQSRLKTLGKKCGVQATPHQLRHTCATMLLNAGMSVFGVQAILGHKYVDTTMRYAKTDNATVAKDYQ